LYFLFVLQVGEIFKVFRPEESRWRTAIIKRIHKDGTFKVIYRDGTTEGHIPAKRIAIPSSRLQGKSFVKEAITPDNTSSSNNVHFPLSSQSLSSPDKVSMRQQHLPEQAATPLNDSNLSLFGSESNQINSISKDSILGSHEEDVQPWSSHDVLLQKSCDSVDTFSMLAVLRSEKDDKS
jgi:hypothetical protein